MKPEDVMAIYWLFIAIAALCFFALILRFAFDEDHLPDLCPNFFKEMPEDAPGKYTAAAHTRGYFCSRVWKSEIVEGRKAAYIRARELALECDRSTRDCGVFYSVTLVDMGHRHDERR